MTTRQKYKNILAAINDKIIGYIDFVEDLNNDAFRKEAGIEEKKAPSMHVTVKAETVIGVVTICSIDFKLD
jgi:hypothetical protein